MAAVDGNREAPGKSGCSQRLKLGRGVRYRLSDVLAFESAAEVGARITAQ